MAQLFTTSNILNFRATFEVLEGFQAVVFSASTPDLLQALFVPNTVEEFYSCFLLLTLPPFSSTTSVYLPKLTCHIFFIPNRMHCSQLSILYL